MENYTREIFSPPLDLVTQGQIQFGCFSDFVKKVNYLDAKRPFGFPVPRYFKYLRLKKWQAAQLGNDDFFILIAIYNAKALSINQFILYDKKNDQLYKYERQVPFWQTKVSKNIQNGLSRYESKNFRIEILNRLGDKYINFKIHIKKQKALPDVEAEFKVNYNKGNYAPLVVSIPFGKNSGMYSYKNLERVKGKILLGEKEIHFNPENSFCIIDDHKGYYPYNMKYDWVTGTAFIDGALNGFNLTDNQSINPELYNENAFWRSGKLYLLPPVKFHRTTEHTEWHITDKYGMVDLKFTPVVENTLRFNLGIVKADYSGPFGSFKGFIKYAPGKKIEVNDFFGMGEKKFIRS